MSSEYDGDERCPVCGIVYHGVLGCRGKDWAATVRRENAAESARASAQFSRQFEQRPAPAPDYEDAILSEQVDNYLPL